MPTAGRLVGAITFGVLAYYMVTITVPLFPDNRVPDNWMVWSIIAGILTGWYVIGPRSGEGMSSAIGVGITGSVVMAFWIVFAHSFRDMIRESFRKVYDTAIEAVVDVFRLMIDYGAELGKPNVIMTLLIGGVICSLITDFFAKRNR